MSALQEFVAHNKKTGTRNLRLFPETQNKNPC